MKCCLYSSLLFRRFSKMFAYIYRRKYGNWKIKTLIWRIWGHLLWVRWTVPSDSIEFNWSSEQLFFLYLHCANYEFRHLWIPLRLYTYVCIYESHAPTYVHNIYVSYMYVSSSKMIIAWIHKTNQMKRSKSYHTEIAIIEYIILLHIYVNNMKKLGMYVCTNIWSDII